MTKPSRCGYVALIGRPNVGKSTLLNRLIGQKISITSRKPQTTRHQIIGIHTSKNTQVVFVDTPGLKEKNPDALRKYMTKSAISLLHDVDLILFIVDGLIWKDEDKWILEKLKQVNTKIILLVNKVDKIQDKSTLLPQLKKLHQSHEFIKIIPISAKSGNYIDKLLHMIQQQMPMSEFLYENAQVTDRSDKFIAAEFIREKLVRKLGQELPYALAVDIESLKEKQDKLYIEAVIWVERAGQKPIVIGKNGEGLKSVGEKARKDLEAYFGKQVVLHTWVKVKKGWSNNIQLLRKLGYHD